MKICLLNDSFPPIIDGVANTVLNYANILTEKKLANVMVGTPKYPNVDYSVYPYPVVPYRSFDVNNLIEGYRIGNPMNVKAMGKLTDFEPDLVHVHCPAMSSVMGRMIRHETNAPIVFTYHTKFDVDLKKAIHADLIRKETLRAIVDNISACDEVWVVSEGAGENLVSLGYEGEYRVMTNGVDFPKGRASEEAVYEATKDYDLPMDVPVYLFVGRLMKYKGLPIIIDALHQMHLAGADFRMIFVGSGSDEDELKQTVEAYGLAKKVFFTGPIRDREALRAWNTRANLFLFPSTYDTNGIVVREAAACGLGSVLVKNSCAAEGITHGRNGYLIDENAESMASLLTELGKDIPAMRALGERAMEEIYVSWNQAVHIAHDRYGAILDAKRTGSLANRKRQPSDLFLALSSDVLEGAQQMRELPRNLHEGMMENIAEIREGIREDFHQAHEDVSGVKEDIRAAKEDFKKIRDQVRDNVVETLEKHLSDSKK